MCAIGAADSAASLAAAPARIDGKVGRILQRRIHGLIERYPEESLAVVRRWLHEEQTRLTLPHRLSRLH